MTPKPVKPGDALTSREQDVARMLGKGCSVRETCVHLRLSVYTVNEHVKRIHRKLDVDSRAELAVEAYKLGLL